MTDPALPPPSRRLGIRWDGTIPLVAVAMALFGAIVWGVQLEAGLGAARRETAATEAKLEMYRGMFAHRLDRLEDRLQPRGPR